MHPNHLAEKIRVENNCGKRCNALEKLVQLDTNYLQPTLSEILSPPKILKTGFMKGKVHVFIYSIVSARESDHK